MHTLYHVFLCTVLLPVLGMLIYGLLSHQIVFIIIIIIIIIIDDDDDDDGHHHHHHWETNQGFGT